MLSSAAVSVILCPSVSAVNTQSSSQHEFLAPGKILSFLILQCLKKWICYWHPLYAGTCLRENLANWLSASRQTSFSCKLKGSLRSLVSILSVSFIVEKNFWPAKQTSIFCLNTIYYEQFLDEYLQLWVQGTCTGETGILSFAPIIAWARSRLFF